VGLQIAERQGLVHSEAFGDFALAEPLRLRMLSFITTSSTGEACVCYIAGVADVAEATGADVYLHEIEIPAVKMMPEMMLAMLGIEELKTPQDIKPLTDGQVLELAGLTIKVLHTPGHSPGSTSFLIEDALFDGDLVFRGSIGRTDFPGGDFDALINSVREKVFVLDPDTKVYPGHMGSTTVGWEKRTNPFLAGQ